MKNSSGVLIVILVLLCCALLLGVLIGRVTFPPSITLENPPTEETLFTTTTGGSSGKININTAGVEILAELPGIGEVIAQRIIAYRQEHGPFTDISQLCNVYGIGQTRLENIKPYITVGGAK